MTVTKVHDHGQTIGLPIGKILGIVDTRADFDAMAKDLQSAGFDKIEVFSGDDGIQLLDRVNGFFFSDMEERVLHRHIEELKAGHLVAMVETPDDRIDEAVEIANRHGARGIVHFGAATVSQYTSVNK